jgi:hypothetical protein
MLPSRHRNHLYNTRCVQPTRGSKVRVQRSQRYSVKMQKDRRHFNSALSPKPAQCGCLMYPPIDMTQTRSRRLGDICSKLTGNIAHRVELAVEIVIFIGALAD